MLALQRSVTRDDPGGYAADGHSGSNLRDVDVVRFEPWHLSLLQLQPSQVALSPTLTMAHGTSLQAAGPCYTAFAGATVLACAGVVEFWPGRSQVWSLLSDKVPQYAIPIHRAVRRFLTGYRVRRLECVIDPRDPRARRWAEHLGFEYEGFMYGYTPEGETQTMMVRLQ